MEILGRAVLIKPDEVPEKTAGGLLIPKTADNKPNTGTVIMAGHACQEVHSGNKVHYARKAASIITIKEVEHHLIFEDKIFYIE